MRRRLFSESELDKEYFKEKIEQQKVENITIDILYHSRTVTLLAIIWILLLYFAYARSNRDTVDNLYHGSIGVAVVFLTVSTMIMPNGKLVYP
ncbi:unnamed protein product [Protopolystoma xenopodis]|uniref:Uncharacterized protein n=1 Tax=Protopolystoma xenopodis TaxID=117903 RepID=A0A3S5CJP1_9PLAT|nr:unnamed protein product [Protopolystoma xenopodis]